MQFMTTTERKEAQAERAQQRRIKATLRKNRTVRLEAVKADPITDEHGNIITSRIKRTASRKGVAR